MGAWVRNASFVSAQNRRTCDGCWGCCFAKKVSLLFNYLSISRAHRFAKSFAGGPNLPTGALLCSSGLWCIAARGWTGENEGMETAAHARKMNRTRPTCEELVRNSSAFKVAPNRLAGRFAAKSIRRTLQKQSIVIVDDLVGFFSQLFLQHSAACRSFRTCISTSFFFFLFV